MVRAPGTSLAGRVRALLLGTRQSIGAVFGNRSLRRIQLALLASLIGDTAYATAVTVWAYGVGGASAVGVFTAVRMASSAITAPIGAALADRFPRRRTLLVTDGARVVLVAAAAGCLSLENPLLCSSWPRLPAYWRPPSGPPNERGCLRWPSIRRSSPPPTRPAARWRASRCSSDRRSVDSCCR
ncbi:MAG: hypothetical protein ABI873_00040 [Marmoricola sp.]